MKQWIFDKSELQVSVNTVDAIRPWGQTSPAAETTRRASAYPDPSPPKGLIMTLCPIAIVVGCKKCPAFSVCPLKTVIGDMPKASEAKAAAPKKK